MRFGPVPVADAEGAILAHSTVAGFALSVLKRLPQGVGTADRVRDHDLGQLRPGVRRRPGGFEELAECHPHWFAEIVPPQHLALPSLEDPRRGAVAVRMCPAPRRGRRGIGRLPRPPHSTHEERHRTD